MKSFRPIIITGHSAEAETVLAGVREAFGETNPIELNAFDTGAIKDLLHLRATASVAILLQVDTMEDLPEAAEAISQLNFFARQDEVKTAMHSNLGVMAANSGTANAAVTAAAQMADMLDAAAWKANTDYKAGQIVTDGGKSYLVMQAVKSIASQKPSSSGMLAVYRPLPEYYDGYMVWESGIDVEAGAIVWNTAKTQLYRAVQAQKPSTWAPGSTGTGAIWAEYALA